MRRRPAFTILEVIIATALIVVFSLLAVPAYNSFSQELEFQSDLQKVAGCIQQASDAARAQQSNQTLFRYVEAYLEYSTTDTLRCTLRYHYYNLNIEGALGIVGPADTVQPNPLVIGNVSSRILSIAGFGVQDLKGSTAATFTRLVFGSLESGRLVAVTSDGSGALSARPPAVPYGRGLRVTLELAAANSKVGPVYQVNRTIDINLLGRVSVR
jgi:type II secretory pathway pseudopilin PulG